MFVYASDRTVDLFDGLTPRQNGIASMTHPPQHLLALPGGSLPITTPRRQSGERRDLTSRSSGHRPSTPRPPTRTSSSAGQQRHTISLYRISAELSLPRNEVEHRAHTPARP